MLLAMLTLLRHRFDAIAAGWQKLVRIASDPYRPELHYMRGPGPRWRAKHRAHRDDGAI